LQLEPKKCREILRDAPELPTDFSGYLVRQAGHSSVHEALAVQVCKA
jgi:hypothetical protein